MVHEWRMVRKSFAQISSTRRVEQDCTVLWQPTGLSKKALWWHLPHVTPLSLSYLQPVLVNPKTFLKRAHLTLQDRPETSMNCLEGLLSFMLSASLSVRQLSIHVMVSISGVLAHLRKLRYCQGCRKEMLIWVEGFLSAATRHYTTFLVFWSHGLGEDQWSIYQMERTPTNARWLAVAVREKE